MSQLPKIYYCLHYSASTGTVIMIQCINLIYNCPVDLFYSYENGFLGKDVTYLQYTMCSWGFACMHILYNGPVDVFYLYENDGYHIICPNYHKQVDCQWISLIVVLFAVDLLHGLLHSLLLIVEVLMLNMITIAAHSIIGEYIVINYPTSNYEV